MKLVTWKINVLEGIKGKHWNFQGKLKFLLKIIFVTHLEVVLVVEIFWKLEASTMKNRGENLKWKVVEKNKKKKKETLRKQKGLPMKSEDLKYLRHFLSDLAEIYRVVLK